MFFITYIVVINLLFTYINIEVISVFSQLTLIIPEILTNLIGYYIGFIDFLLNIFIFSCIFVIYNGLLTFWEKGIWTYRIYAGRFGSSALASFFRIVEYGTFMFIYNITKSKFSYHTVILIPFYKLFIIYVGFSPIYIISLFFLKYIIKPNSYLLFKDMCIFTRTIKDLRLTVDYYKGITIISVRE